MVADVLLNVVQPLENLSIQFTETVDFSLESRYFAEAFFDHLEVGLDKLG